MIDDIVVAFKHFIRVLSEAENTLDTDTVRNATEDICRLSNVGKFTVVIYENVAHENTDKNTTIEVYKDGGSDGEPLVVKKVTGGGGMLVYSYYHKADTEAWTERIRNRLDFMTSLMFTFSSRYVLDQAVRRYAYRDDMDYYNLRYFIKEIGTIALKKGLKGKAVAQFNLKHFRAVNLQIGRTNSDIVMHRYVDTMNKIKGGTLPVCRLGGDNFIMMFDAVNIDKVLDHLRGAVITFGDDFSERVMISATAGIYVIGDDFVFTDKSDIMDKIMPAANIAKSSDKEDIVFYDTSLDRRKNHSSMIQHQFSPALSNEEFLVYYQPKIDVNDNTMVGAEALCRWYHDGKLIPPMEFIPILEQGTDICKLDFYMIDHVCRDIRRWLDEGREVVRISVNLSRKHMLDVDLLNHLMEIIDRHDIPYKYIEVELTETTTDIEFKDLKRVVSGLQENGIAASVDDFGMGYSSLNLIKEIPWNVIKIDKSIVPVDEDDECSARSVMFKHVVAMAREMGLECIAEGVETEAQVETLRRNGCDVAQGYYFDRPLPCSEFEKKLKKQDI